MARHLLVVALVLCVGVGCNSENALLSSDEAATTSLKGIGSAGGPATVSGVENYIATLSGEDAGTSSRGRGVARFQVSRDDESVTFQLNVANVQNVTMAHIHISEDPGGNGPPAVWLYPDGPPPVEIPGRSDGVLAQGTFTAADFVAPFAELSVEDLVMRIKMNRAYVNVHTTQNPPGEIRGQIR